MVKPNGGGSLRRACFIRDCWLGLGFFKMCYNSNYNMFSRIAGVVDNHKSSIRTKWFLMTMIVSAVVVAAYVAPIANASFFKTTESHLVTIYDDGEETTIITKKDNVKGALEDAKIQVSKIDRINHKMSDKLDGNFSVINIKRARPVTVTDSEGRRTRVMTAETDTSKIATEANADLEARDTSKISPISDVLSAGGVGEEVQISRAKTVHVTLYGQKVTLRTQKDTVKDMLAESGVSPTSSDTLSVSADAPVTDGMSMEVWRNGVQTKEATEDIAYDTKTVEDSSKVQGYSEVETEGKVGKKTVIYEVNMQNGKEVSRKKISEAVTVPATTKVIVKGTKVNLPSGSHEDWMREAGIPESDWGYTNYIISHESGWRYNATNASSGAYGLPQSLPGSKMASAGSDWKTNPITQLKWFYSYCQGRYGSVAGAYSHWQTHHSY